MQVINIEINKIKPYEKNPRKNDEAVDNVMNSIKEFGFKAPIVIDKDYVIVAGHTRYKASKKLKLKEVPCIIADDLTEEQVKAFRLADNKAGELAEWDFDLLTQELDDIKTIDMNDFGFLDNNESYLDDLFDEELGAEKDSNEFSMTFVFGIDDKDNMDEYIDKFGKDHLTNEIIRMIRGAVNA